jgi:capsular polysaccharide biosynthesis protein
LHGTQFNGRGDDVHFNSLMDRGYISEEMYGDPRAGFQINLLQAIRRRLAVIALVIVVVMGFTTGLTFLQPPLYTASTKILVDEKSHGESVNAPSNTLGLTSVAATLAEQVATHPVAQGVIERLKLSTPADALLSNLSVEQIEGTLLIEVTYADSDPQEAQRIVNAVGTVFSERVAEENLGGSGNIAYVVEKAVLPTSPVSPNPVRDILLALPMGFMLGVGLVCLLEYRYDTRRSPDEVEHLTGVPTLGVIPASKA